MAEVNFQPVRRKKKSFKADLVLERELSDVNNEKSALDSDTILQPAAIPDLIIESEENDTDKPDVHDSEFPVLSAQDELRRNARSIGATSEVVQVRRILVPSHRMSPLKKHWREIVEPIVQHLQLLIRMNLKRRCVEIKMTSKTPEVAFLQKAADFVKSFMLGFDVKDCIALLRLDDLFVQSFEIKDVKNLTGDNLSRCIGRVSGKDGKTKYAIENATLTRIVLADSYIHILGAFQNIRAARDSLCSLILGSPAGKVYNRLRTVSKRLQERL